MNTEKMTLHITLDRGAARLIVLVLLLLGMSGSIALAREEPAAGATASPSLLGGSGRYYYLTNGVLADGAGASGVCAAGYHMASLWEVYDVSNLVYNTEIGFTYGNDTGEGPPAGFAGWIRTGYSSSTTGTAGQGNCLAWTNNSTISGTLAYLTTDWALGTDIGSWNVLIDKCNQDNFVWCVED